jgi:Ala-tRNA(Pro) deacylase
MMREIALVDGAAPAVPADLFERLDSLGIVVRTVQHPPVFTVEEAKALRGEIEGCHTKNLFLRNKKGKMWLVVCLEDRAIDLKDLAARLSAGRLSFGSAERLAQYLGVIPGAVTPFAIINDKSNSVKVAVDQAILGSEPLNFHPLDNAQTTSIGSEDLLRFLEAEEHRAQLIDFDRPLAIRDPRLG